MALQYYRAVSTRTRLAASEFEAEVHLCRRSEAVDLEADFKPNLLNSAIYLISLSQQVSTFAVNFQGRPFREGITENPALYYGLL